MALIDATEPAAVEYDRLAPYYDAFTAGYAYERWVSELERHALALGLSGQRALDLACGTGKSTEPLVARGYSVLACDVSEGMVREAQQKFPAQADAFFVADMRRLPWLGQFDFILCLDDAINYLLGEDELTAAFENVAAVLAPGGMFVFDVNSLLTYRTAFAATTVREGPGVFFVWRGEARPTMEPRAIATATVEIFAERDGLGWERTCARHVQRHHPPEVVQAALARAGLQCAAVAGQHPGANLEAEADDEAHIKVVFFAHHR